MTSRTVGYVGTRAVTLGVVLGFAALAGCARAPVADPQPDIIVVERDPLAALTLARTTPTEPLRKRGVLGFLGGNSAPLEPAGPAAPTPEAVAEESVAAPSENGARIVADVAVPEASPEPARRPRLFGFLRRPAPAAAAPDAGNKPAIEALETEAAALPDPAAGAAETPRRRLALFGGSRAGASAPAAPGAMPPAGPAPFGEVIEVCGVSRRDLGTEVARSPGSGEFRLYDTDPAATQPRTQYLTGFKDGCARGFTASLSLFGSPQVHEATRYDPQNTTAYSATDSAYETVKNRVCGVRRGQFCPQGRARRLARDAAFLTVYRGFGDSGPWMEMFLSKGRLLAYQTQSR